MTLPNSGTFAARFEEKSKHFTGSKSAGAIPNSKMSTLRAAGMNEIYALSKSNNVPVDNIITTVLLNSDNELNSYIRSKGETPVPDPVGRAVQAILLRAADVSTTAGILDISDEDALKSIEASEQDAINNNQPDASNVLTIPVQAAIACAMEYASSGGKTMKQLVTGVIGLAKASQVGASNLDGDDDITDWADIGGDPTTDPSVTTPDVSGASGSDTNLSPVSVGSALAVIPVSAPGSIVANPTISNSASSSALIPASGPANQQGGVLNSLSSILSGITSTATQVQNTVKSVTASGTAINKSLSSLGASSIAQYVQNNSGMIIIVVVILLVIFMMARKRG